MDDWIKESTTIKDIYKNSFCTIAATVANSLITKANKAQLYEGQWLIEPNSVITFTRAQGRMESMDEPIRYVFCYRESISFPGYRTHF